ncbi:hypothetical protein [Flavobacterium sp. ENC]|uniref:hypothetical protein n=1 Tax=Flavobacterium sp. ENC TaxID=2897330 RepID=UPI001E3873FC|nr:hypothetical protein [Flavobacterium sp. ENC]MCD0465976.1 hypothetical protein [Flavobacterium sp. ENC]
MKKYIEFIKSNLILFSVAGYGLGLLYMSIYYYFFNVPIIYYLTLNDILFFSITLILPTVFAVLLIEYIVVRPLKKFIYKRELENTEEAKFNLYCSRIISLFAVIAMFTEPVQINPNLLFYILFSSFALIARLESSTKGRNLAFGPIITAVGFLLGLYHLITYSRAGFANKDVQFSYYGKLIKTGFSQDLNYIGETSSTLFIYNFRKKITYKYEKENTCKLTYIDKIDKEFSVKKDLKFYPLGSIKKKIQQDSIYNTYEWSTFDERTYWWAAEKNPVGLSKLIWEIDYVLYDNDFDFEDPSYEHSSLPSKIIISEDFKAASDAINSGNSELHKRWELNSGEINLHLSKRAYIITVEYKKGYPKKEVNSN